MSLETAQDPMFQQRTGAEGLKDLALNHARILLEASDLCQEMGSTIEPLSYISQVTVTVYTKTSKKLKL